MPLYTFNLAGQSYRLPDLVVDAQQTLNLFAEHIEDNNVTTKTYLRPTPGLTQFSTAGAGPIRALFKASNDVVLCVSGTGIYRLDGAVCTQIGTLTTGGGTICMADNGTDVLIVDGTSNGLVYNLSTGSLTTLALPAPCDGAVCIDSYFVLKATDDRQFYVSDVASTIFDVLNVAAAEGAPDPIQSIRAAGRELWIFGTETTEVWATSGGAGFPFVRLDGIFLEQGTAAPQSPTVLAGAVYWLGRGADGQGIVWRSNGYVPERISTHAIEQCLSAFTRINDAVGFSYVQEGHAFYVLSLPTAGRTFVYDAATSLWHERMSLNAATGTMDTWRVNGVCSVGGSCLATDRLSGTIFKLDSMAATEAGQNILRRRVVQYIGKAGRTSVHHALTLSLSVGIGTQINAIQSPQVMLRYSDDYGGTWSNERWTGIGKLGDRRPQVRYTRLGQSRQRLYELSYADPAIINLMQANLEYS